MARKAVHFAGGQDPLNSSGAAPIVSVSREKSRSSKKKDREGGDVSRASSCEFPLLCTISSVLQMTFALFSSQRRRRLQEQLLRQASPGTQPSGGGRV